MQSATSIVTSCYHCGEVCNNNTVIENNKNFCCTGCKNVYHILEESNLCNYYSLNNKPGSNQKITIRKEKFAFLDDDAIAQKFVQFKNENEVHVNFYLPQIHCSSCLWLLENLYKLNNAIVSSRVHFTNKEVDIIFKSNEISIRQIVELLTSIGYEPYISLQHMQTNKKPIADKTLIYQLAVAGFCFGNVMLLSFPEYLGLSETEPFFPTLFRYVSLLLSLPVLLFSAMPFYKAAVNNVQHKFLSVDAPVALAIILTFIRSMYEVFFLQSSGYFDSMTGIVFFMLMGRVLQNKTYQQLNFTRDYTAYFPISVDVIIDGKEVPTPLHNIEVGQTIVVYNESLIPADGIVTRGTGLIDYSFVTGESNPIVKEMGELIYAGGKQKKGRIEILVMKEVAQSYLTKLWNKQSNTKDAPTAISTTGKFINILNKYFSIIVLAIAIIACVYWAFVDNSKILNVATTILIIACPCALILAGTFANGTIINIFGNNKLYIKNASVIERLATINHIVFDKTGTLTSTSNYSISYHGIELTQKQQQQIASLAIQSNHPLSKAIATHINTANYITVNALQEIVGLGVEGIIQGNEIRLGSKEFVYPQNNSASNSQTKVYISFNEEVLGYFVVEHCYRKNLLTTINCIQKVYSISVLSGDNDGQKSYLEKKIGKKVQQYFFQTPEQKFKYIEALKKDGKRVLMIGDGLNDAGALQASTIGIAVAENTNTFTPASDAIIDGESLHKIYSFIKLSSANKKVIGISFTISLIYNVIGLYYALQGLLSPLIAAILMPSSTISIVLITYGINTWYSKKNGLL
jgi:P-type Cu+ transporter